MKTSLFSYQVIDKSFGFDTAVEEAQRAINAAHVEAQSAENGIGVVKLMGRYSGNMLLQSLEKLSMHSKLPSIEFLLPSSRKDCSMPIFTTNLIRHFHCWFILLLNNKLFSAWLAAKLIT